MTRAVEELLDTFDHLPEAQQREAASVILRRVQRLALDPMSDDELVLSAEGLFLELNKDEGNRYRGVK